TEPGASISAVHAALQEHLIRRGARASHLLVAMGSGGSCPPLFGSPSNLDHQLRADDVLCWSVELEGPDGYWVELAQTYALGEISADQRRAQEAAAAMSNHFVGRARPGSVVRDLHAEIAEIADQ